MITRADGCAKSVIESPVFIASEELSGFFNNSVFNSVSARRIKKQKQKMAMEACSVPRRQAVDILTEPQSDCQGWGPGYH